MYADKALIRNTTGTQRVAGRCLEDAVSALRKSPADHDISRLTTLIRMGKGRG